MASAQASESNEISAIGTGHCNNGARQLGIYPQETKNMGDDLLDDLDSYLEDINDRLTISRMINDSVIKGMVNAISQEAAEVVAAKEVELARLKEVSCRQQFGYTEIVPWITSRKHDEQQVLKHNGGSLCLLSQVAKENLERLERCIVDPKGSNLGEISSTCDITGLGETLQENLGTHSDLCEAFYSLKAMLEAMCQQLDAIASTPNASAMEWKLELEIRGEVEAMVLCTIVQGLQNEYEKRLWNVNNVLALIDRFKEISCLCHELDSLQKCLFSPEVGRLSPQVSLETDHFHRIDLSNLGLPSRVSMPENLETSPLKHMSTQELYQHFRTEITKMKRDHESNVQQMTDKYFALKRELLKERELVRERGPSVAFRKDKDFETLKKKMSEVILKLNDIVRENEKLSEFCNHPRDILDSLLSENNHLRDLLNGRKLEAYYLSLQAVDATKKVPQHSSAEENLHKMVRGLRSSLLDAHTEAYVSEKVYKCILKEMAAMIKSGCEDLDVKSIILQDTIGIVYGEAFRAADVARKSVYEEISDLQSTVMQRIYGIVFQEVLGDMSMELNKLKKKCLKEDESLGFLQTKVSEVEKELTVVVEENIRLKLQVLVLENSIKEKDKSYFQVTTLLEKERMQLGLVMEELNKSMDLRTQQEASLSARNEELVLLKDKLEDCQKQIDLYKTEMDTLNKELEVYEFKLRICDEEKTKMISVLEQEQNQLAFVKAKDREHMKQMESLCHVIQGLSKSFADFELRTNESIHWHNVRLENSVFQLHSLIPKVNVLRRTCVLYKERLENRCSDLQKAESEVDLLGDEVDALLNLLEKIYVALDHYSPILKHYPGIIETLKLVKRELSGEAVKAV